METERKFLNSNEQEINRLQKLIQKKYLAISRIMLDPKKATRVEQIRSEIRDLEKKVDDAMGEIPF